MRKVILKYTDCINKQCCQVMLNKKTWPFKPLWDLFVICFL